VYILWLFFFKGNSCVHTIFCSVYITGSWPLPKWGLHWVQSSASSFIFQYPLISLRSLSGYLHLLLCLPITSIFPSVTCFRGHFIHNMQPTYAWFQASTMKWVGNVLFWIIIQGIVVISYWPFRATYQSPSSGIKNPRGCPETVRNCHCLLCDNPEEKSSHVTNPVGFPTSYCMLDITVLLASV
jgi:hypothetical protein